MPFNNLYNFLNIVLIVCKSNLFLLQNWAVATAGRPYMNKQTISLGHSQMNLISLKSKKTKNVPTFLIPKCLVHLLLYQLLPFIQWIYPLLKLEMQKTQFFQLPFLVLEILEHHLFHPSCKMNKRRYVPPPVIITSCLWDLAHFFQTEGWVPWWILNGNNAAQNVLYSFTKNRFF